MINRFSHFYPSLTNVPEVCSSVCTIIYLVLLATLLTRCVRHLNQILLICSCACVFGYPVTFQQENACAISCFN